MTLRVVGLRKLRESEGRVARGHPNGKSTVDSVDSMDSTDMFTVCMIKQDVSLQFTASSAFFKLQIIVT